jgi:two-component system OmpR family response regulator
MLIEHVWNDRCDVLTNIVDVYINALRSKIDRGFETELIRTAYGVGYMISDHLKKDVAETVAETVA